MTLAGVSLCKHKTKKYMVVIDYAQSLKRKARPTKKVTGETKFIELGDLEELEDWALTVKTPKSPSKRPPRVVPSRPSKNPPRAPSKAPPRIPYKKRSPIM